MDSEELYGDLIEGSADETEDDCHSGLSLSNAYGSDSCKVIEHGVVSSQNSADSDVPSRTNESAKGSKMNFQTVLQSVIDNESRKTSCGEAQEDLMDDIYSLHTEKERQHNHELNQVQQRIRELEEENRNLQQDKKQLQYNIALLLATAKKEVKTHQSLILALRKQLLELSQENEMNKSFTRSRVNQTSKTLDLKKSPSKESDVDKFRESVNSSSTPKTTKSADDLECRGEKPALNDYSKHSKRSSSHDQSKYNSPNESSDNRHKTNDHKHGSWARTRTRDKSERRQLFSPRKADSNDIRKRLSSKYAIDRAKDVLRSRHRIRSSTRDRYSHESPVKSSMVRRSRTTPNKHLQLTPEKRTSRRSPRKSEGVVNSSRRRHSHRPAKTRSSHSEIRSTDCGSEDLESLLALKHKLLTQLSGDNSNSCELPVQQQILESVSSVKPSSNDLMEADTTNDCNKTNLVNATKSSAQQETSEQMNPTVQNNLDGQEMSQESVLLIDDAGISEAEGHVDNRSICGNNDVGSSSVVSTSETSLSASHHNMGNSSSTCKTMDPVEKYSQCTNYSGVGNENSSMVDVKVKSSKTHPVVIPLKSDVKLVDPRSTRSTKLEECSFIHVPWCNASIDVNAEFKTFLPPSNLKKVAPESSLDQSNDNVLDYGNSDSSMNYSNLNTCVEEKVALDVLSVILSSNQTTHQSVQHSSDNAVSGPVMRHTSTGNHCVENVESASSSQPTCVSPGEQHAENTGCIYPDQPFYRNKGKLSDQNSKRLESFMIQTVETNMKYISIDSTKCLFNQDITTSVLDNNLLRAKSTPCATDKESRSVNCKTDHEKGEDNSSRTYLSNSDAVKPKAPEVTKPFKIPKKKRPVDDPNVADTVVSDDKSSNEKIFVNPYDRPPQRCKIVKEQESISKDLHIDNCHRSDRVMERPCSIPSEKDGIKDDSHLLKSSERVKDTEPVYKESSRNCHSEKQKQLLPEKSSTSISKETNCCKQDIPSDVGDEEVVRDRKFMCRNVSGNKHLHCEVKQLDNKNHQNSQIKSPKDIEPVCNENKLNFRSGKQKQLLPEKSSSTSISKETNFCKQDTPSDRRDKENVGDRKVKRRDISGSKYSHPEVKQLDNKHHQDKETKTSKDTVPIYNGNSPSRRPDKQKRSLRERSSSPSFNRDTAESRKVYPLNYKDRENGGKRKAVRRELSKDHHSHREVKQLDVRRHQYNESKSRDEHRDHYHRRKSNDIDPKRHHYSRDRSNDHVKRDIMRHTLKLTDKETENQVKDTHELDCPDKDFVVAKVIQTAGCKKLNSTVGCEDVKSEDIEDGEIVSEDDESEIAKPAKKRIRIDKEGNKPSKSSSHSDTGKKPANRHHAHSRENPHTRKVRRH